MLTNHSSVQSPVYGPVPSPVYSPVHNPVPSPVHSPVHSPVQSPVQGPVPGPVQTLTLIYICQHITVIEWIHVDERTLEPLPLLSFSKTLGGNVVQKDERV